MVKRDVKRPVYDVNACMLYDFMTSQGLTEEIIMRRIGMDKEKEKYGVKRFPVAHHGIQ